MKLGLLFSGGKDSCAALEIAREAGHEISILLSIDSKNKESYMFHTPNIERVKAQAEAIDLPIIVQETQGKKEIELEDLKKLIKKAIKKYNIEGIITGAIESVYQATRVEKICDQLNIFCFHPLWKIDQLEYLDWLVKKGFIIYIGGVFGYPLDKKWLGRKLNNKMISELKELNEKYGIQPSGEGGELESFCAFGPGWQKEIVINNADISYENYSGVWDIKDFELIDKKIDKIIVPEKKFNSKILIINTSNEPLVHNQFIKPLLRVCKAKVKNYDRIIKDDLDVTHIIIAGTTLKDMNFENGNFDWLKDYKGKVLGICAGMQIIAKVFDIPIIKAKEIGMTQIKTVKENSLCSGEFESYSLHQKSIAESDKIKVLAKSKDCIELFSINEKIFGSAFHPEVRNQELIKKFLEL